MSKLAVIGTFYRRYGSFESILKRVLVDSTRLPDECWLMCEEPKDFEELSRVVSGLNVNPKVRLSIQQIPTPRREDGKYAVVPYSNKINRALDETSADYIVYLTDDSWPEYRKYELMAKALDDNPNWGAVYCAQRLTTADGHQLVRSGVVPIEDAYCVLDHTQVMHRRTKDRWIMDTEHIRLGDAFFWRSLHASIGPFYPVPHLLDVTEQEENGITNSVFP